MGQGVTQELLEEYQKYGIVHMVQLELVVHVWQLAMHDEQVVLFQ